jgi:hypothetical protein
MAVRDLFIVRAPGLMGRFAEENTFPAFQAAIENGDQKGPLVSLTFMGRQPSFKSSPHLFVDVAEKGWADITYALLELGADPNYLPAGGSCSPLFLAVQSGSALTVKNCWMRGLTLM